MHPDSVGEIINELAMKNKAMNYVHEHGVITNKVYRDLTGASDRTAHRDLELLVERGRLKGVGQRAARRYVLA